MQRKDYYALGLLYLIVLFIFYPLFYTDYIFMDEAVEIWNMKPGTGYIMFLDDGRALTEWLQYPFFSRIDTLHEITYIRIISLLGWLVCLPLWYAIIKRIVHRQVYGNLPFATCLYLVTSVPFVLSVQWATCMQFFIAQTCGLLSGVLVYNGIRFTGNRMRILAAPVVAALLLGVACMFFYQNAVGCYLIPFLLHFINPKAEQKNRMMIAGITVYFAVYVVYYILYRICLQAYDIPDINRNAIHFNPWEKIKWFLARPLERSFRFSVLTHEDSQVSKYYFMLMLAAWALLAFKRFGKTNAIKALTYLAVCFGIFVIAYLPNLIIKENFASNRTLFALNLCVWIVCAEMFFFFVRNKLALQISGIIVGTVFILAARNNFRNEFLHPVQQETLALKNYIQQHYHNRIRTVYFIRPPYDFFSKKYNIYESMDEFGVPQTYLEWVPDPLTRQLVFEKTRNRKQAEQLSIRQWTGKDSFIRSGAAVDSSVLVVDVQEIMQNIKP